MDKFKEYKIVLSDKNKKLVIEYLEKIKKFISKNNLDNELYFDIEERVFEKLSIHKNLNELIIKQTLNEIGDPKDIFDIDENKINKNIFVYFKSLKNKTIDSVSKIFKTGFNIKNFFVFIKTIIIGIIGFIKKILINLFNLLKIILNKLFWFIKKILINLFNFSKKIFNKLFWFSKKIFNLCGNIIGYIIIFISISMLVFIPILYNGFVLGQIDYLSIIPRELIIGYCFFILGIAIFGIYFIIKKRFLLVFILSGICFVLTISFGFIGGTRLYNNHSYTGEIIKNYSTTYTGELLSIDNNNFDIYGNIYLFNEFSREYDIRILPSKDEFINLELSSKIFTSDDIKLKEIESKLNEFELKIKDNILSFGVKNGKIFNDKYEFVPMFREIKLYLPINKKLNIGYFRYNQLRGVEILNCKNNNYYNDFIIGNIDGNIVCLEKENENENKNELNVENSKIETKNEIESECKNEINIENNINSENETGIINEREINTENKVIY